MYVRMHDESMQTVYGYAQLSKFFCCIAFACTVAGWKRSSCYLQPQGPQVGRLQDLPCNELTDPGVAPAGHRSETNKRTFSFSICMKGNSKDLLTSMRTSCPDLEEKSNTKVFSRCSLASDRDWAAGAYVRTYACEVRVGSSTSLLRGYF